MPFIIFAGVVYSSTTTLSTQLKEFIIQEKKKEVYLINEEYFSLNKEEFYKESQTEKMLRSKMKSECEKYLDDSKVVILDSLNYIKGYRYELFCLVRNFKIRHCVVILLIK